MGDYDDELDGGAAPGGAPEIQPCPSPGCPACEARSQTSPCIHSAGHDGWHECANGDWWEDYDVYAPRCFDLCPTDSAWCIKDKGHDQVHWCGKHEW